MTTFNKNLSEPWFSLIKLGLKKCEGRLKKGDFDKIKKGDFIIFENNEFGFNRSFRIKITSVKYYDSFLDYLKKETLEKCLPGIETFDEGLKIYYKYYNKEDEQKYKIVAIRLKKNS